MLLSLVGIGPGVSLFEPEEGSPVNGSLKTTAVWQFVGQLVALGVGGYAAGRLAGALHPTGAMPHGAVMWAVIPLAAVWMATSAAMGIANVAGSAVSGIASRAVQATIPEDVQLPDLSVGSISMEDLPPQLRRTLRENGLTPETFQAEARAAFRAVLSRQEQADLREAATSTAQDIATSPGDVGADINDVLDGAFGRGGILSEEDRQAALTVMEERFGLSPQPAEAQVDYARTRAGSRQQDAALASMPGLVAAVGGAHFGRPAEA